MQLHQSIARRRHGRVPSANTESGVVPAPVAELGGAPTFGERTHAL